MGRRRDVDPAIVAAAARRQEQLDVERQRELERKTRAVLGPRAQQMIDDTIRSTKKRKRGLPRGTVDRSLTRRGWVLRYAWTDGPGPGRPLICLTSRGALYCMDEPMTVDNWRRYVGSEEGLAELLAPLWME